MAKYSAITLDRELCKSCGRCVASCNKHAIAIGSDTNQRSGMIPYEIDYELCNHCGLCITACPEPWAITEGGYDLENPAARIRPAKPAAIQVRRIPLPDLEPLVLKGNHASAVGALLAGCRHVFGYPITPSTEGAEYLARVLPGLEGVFMQSCSEVATVNHMYGAGGAGVPTMTFTSSPGFTLMLEGISYMIGAELPGVFINVMRPGPGLGYIGPEQSDIKLCARGLGHGNTHAIVLAPSSPQEMLDLTMLAFELSFKYRNPVVVAADGYLGQITGRVTLPAEMVEPGLPDWAVRGDAEHKNNLNSSILQDWVELEKHNEHISGKYRAMERDEQLSSEFKTDGAELLIVACNIPARMAKAAVETLRREGHKVGLFQPLTIWPFPIDALAKLLVRINHILVVEASDGQLENELRLALNKADIAGIQFDHLRHMGGILPDDAEIVRTTHSIMGVHA